MRLVPAHLTTRFRLGAALAVIIGLSPLSAHADAISDFYQHKTVKLILSTSAGGGYDTYARVISRHIPKYIPGHPDVIVQNMPGAGGIKAGNYLYQVAEQDGSVFGAVQNNVPFEPLMGTKAARYDSLKFNWLGSPNSEVGLLLVWHGAPVNTFEDVTKHEIIMGASGAASTPAFYARILSTVLGAKLKLINGYPGQTEAFLAMEKGEIDGYPSTFWASLKTTKPDWLRDKQVKILLQYGEKPHPELPDVPVARDFAKTDEDKMLLDAAMAALTVGRPYVAPPKVPAERVAVLRDAMMSTFKDADFLAEAEKLRLEVDENPQSGEDILNVLKRTYGTPKPVLDRLIAIYEAGQKQAGN